MINPHWLLAALIASAPFADAAEIDPKQYHLRSGTNYEWQEFANKTPHAKRLDIRFDARRNPEEATLLVRQYNVKLDWRVEINGTKVGNLVLMEDTLIATLNVPAGTLRNGVNTLSVIPPKENDDVIVGPFHVDVRPLEKALSDAVAQVDVTDSDSGKATPCRITVTDLSGTLAAIRNAGSTPLAVRPGVAYTGSGQARLGLLAGDYVFHASRGFEYSLATQRVSIAKGAVAPVRLQIRREVPTPDLVACDTHIHTFTHAKHGDATIEERMLTLAGEGIELPISTEHNMLVDFTETARRLDVEKHFTPVVGCEVTTKAGHFNVFPIQPGSPVPDHRLTDWPKLMQSIRATPGVQVAILNHPQDVHSGFVPFAATNLNGISGENLRGFEFSFDAVELINSGALRSDLMEVYRNWFALLNYGYRVSGAGASDSHDVSRFIVGQGRTYVACDDADPARLDIVKAASNIRAGRTYVSMGLLPRIQVEGRFGPGDLAAIDGDRVDLDVTVLGPSWSAADKVELYQNGVLIAERRVESTSSVEKVRLQLALPQPGFDAHLVAIATGRGVTSPHWAIPRPYQPSSPVWEPRVIGSSNPIWIDSDGDGKFTSAREYARPLVQRHAQHPKELLSELQRYDGAVAAQAASLLKAAGVNLRGSEIQKSLADAAPFVKEGFLSYIATVEARH